MLTIQIVCIGKLKEDYWIQACREYQKRLGAYCRIELTELSEYRLPSHPSDSQIRIGLEKEGTDLLARSKGGYRVALCIEGKMLDSAELSEKIESVALGGQSAISFLIGGSYGLSDEVKRVSDFKLSMSPMTFPHQMARVMILEQIYRAFQIQSNGKYHK